MMIVWLCAMMGMSKQKTHRKRLRLSLNAWALIIIKEEGAQNELRTDDHIIKYIMFYIYLYVFYMDMFRKSLTILFHGVTTLWPRKCCYGMEQLVLYFILYL